VPSRFTAPAAGARGLWLAGVLFVLLGAALSAVAVWLIGNGFADDRALSLWAKILMVRDAGDARLEYLGVVYPHLPTYCLLVLRMLPGLDSPFLPYLFSSLLVAGVIAWWAWSLAPSVPSMILAAALGLVLVHPFTLWTATTSPQLALGFAFFYLLLRQIARLQEDDSPQVYLRIGVLLALMFFADERASYLALALLLLLPAVAPADLLRRAPVASTSSSSRRSRSRSVPGPT
jgi:hypothetical protein